MVSPWPLNSLPNIADSHGELGTESPRRALRWPCFAPLHPQIVFVGSGRLGLPEAAVSAFGLGCDLINVGREALLAIGCIQAQRCHTNHCPTGITTQHPWLIRGPNPTLKAARLAVTAVAAR